MPKSDYEVFGPGSENCSTATRRFASSHRLPVGRRPGLFRRRALCRLVRHPQQPHAALRRDRRRRQRVPRAVRQHQRQHGRTGRAAASPASIQRPRVSRTEFDGSIITIADRLEWQAPESAERRGGEAPTARSGSPIRPTASRPTMRATRPRARSAPATSTGSIRQRRTRRCRHHRHGAAERHRLLARRDASSTWSTPAARMARTTPPTCACSMSTSGKKVAGRPGFRRRARPGCSTAFASIEGRQHLDQRWPTVSTATTPDGTLIGKVKVPEGVANVCVLGRRQAQRACYICGHHVAFMVRLMVNGAKTMLRSWSAGRGDRPASVNACAKGRWFSALRAKDGRALGRIPGSPRHWFLRRDGDDVAAAHESRLDIAFFICFPLDLDRRQDHP